MKSILSDLKILEVASVLAGPAVGMFFAERGAKVVKIENKNTNGDTTRHWKLSSEDKDSPISAYFCSVNWGKEYLFMDLTDPACREEVEQLIIDADILIANFKMGDAEKFKLDFPTVSKINPNIIHAELSGFGSKSGRVAYDLVLQAETGFMYMNGTENSGPIKMPLAMIDVLAAHQLKEGILEALLCRNNVPKAYHVEVSLYDAAVATLTNQATNYLMADYIPQPIGSIHPNISPYGETFKSKDDHYITFAVGSDSQFIRLMEFLEIELQDHFMTNKDRVTHRAELEVLLAEKVKLQDVDYLVDELIKLKVPVARINNLEEVFRSPQAQELILEENIDGIHTKRVKTAVYTITEA